MFEFQSLRLAEGFHRNPGSEMCIMECVAFIAGERHSDNPACCCPVLAAVGRRINDWMTQEERDEHLAPMLFDFAGTVGKLKHQIQRGFIAADYAVRVFAPIALRAAGLEAEAVKLESCPKIVNVATARHAEGEAADAADAADADADADAADAAAYAAYAANAANTYAAAAAAAANNVAANNVAAATNAAANNAVDAAANAADADCATAVNRRAICLHLAQMLKDMIAVHSTAPKEWNRAPETLPCLVK